MIHLLNPYEVIFAVSYIIVAAGSINTLIEFNKKVNGKYARKDFLAILILVFIAAFWPAIIFLALINRSLYIKVES